jgi:predicted nucleic acid-binding protein
MIIPDVNLLLYANLDATPQHAAARAWFEKLLSGTERTGLAPAAVLGFVRLSTSRRVYVEPLTVEDAVTRVRSWLDRPNVVLLEQNPEKNRSLADGYFVLPYTIGAYLATAKQPKVTTDHPEFKKAIDDAKGRLAKLLSVKGKRTVDSFHRELGMLMWNKCGMARTEKGLKELLVEIPKLREEFWQNVNVPGSADSLNQALEKAGRVADFFEFAEVMVMDALDRDESCGGHFREEHQYEDGEAKRNDEKFQHVSVWEWKGEGQAPVRHKEPLVFETFKPSIRSYK